MSFIKKIIKKFKFYLGTEISLNLDIYSCSSDIFPDLYLIIRRYRIYSTVRPLIPEFCAV